MLGQKFLSKYWLKYSFMSNKIVVSQVRSIETKSVKDLLDSNNTEKLCGTKFRVVGWINSVRNQKEIKFAHLSDGSHNLQLVFLNEMFKPKVAQVFDSLHFHTAIECEGMLVKSSHKKQNVELQLTDLNIIGECDPNSYPFKAKANYTLEQLRQHIHLRSHSNLFASLMKLRSELTWSIHEYFYQRSFCQIHTPIITTNNCEGGCETFQVSQLI